MDNTKIIFGEMAGHKWIASSDSFLGSCIELSESSLPALRMLTSCSQLLFSSPDLASCFDVKHFHYTVMYVQVLVLLIQEILGSNLV
jgi:hypothetical protein